MMRSILTRQDPKGPTKAKEKAVGRMETNAKIVTMLSGLLFLASLLTHPKTLLAKPEVSEGNLIMYARYVAKEYCSCRFVVGQTEKICRAEAKADNLLVRITEDREERIIETRNSGGKARARWVNERLGCQLEF